MFPRHVNYVHALYMCSIWILPLNMVHKFVVYLPVCRSKSALSRHSVTHFDNMIPSDPTVFYILCQGENTSSGELNVNMLRSLLTFLVLNAVVRCGANYFHVGFKIDDASVVDLNGIYVCYTDARCQLVVPPRREPVDQHSTEMWSTSVFANGAVQKRWYISVKTNSSATPTNVYGAVELSPLPNFTLKEWKRLGNDTAFEPHMRTGVLFLPNVAEMEQKQGSFENHWTMANVLLLQRKHSAFDGASLRGRYITTALHTESLHIDRIIIEASDATARILATVWKCDYLAVQGSVTDANTCYSTTAAQLRQQLSVLAHRDGGDGSDAAFRAGSEHSALRCGLPSTTRALQLEDTHHWWNCHLFALQVRHARHLLIHSLDPFAAIVVLERASTDRCMFTSPSVLVLRALAECLLGDCSTAVAGVEVQEVTAECDAVLAQLSQSSDYSQVQVLFSQICLPWQRGGDNGGVSRGGRRSPATVSVDRARSTVASLLSVGATKVAALHVRRALEIALSLSLSQRNTAVEGWPDLLQLFVRMPKLSRIAPQLHTNSITNATDNVQAALVLWDTLLHIQKNDAVWLDFLADGDLMSLLVGTLLQCTSPVTLVGGVGAGAGEHGEWVTEVLLLRLAVVEVLTDLVKACGRQLCALSDPVSNVGARGLFLLAYQGLGLLAEPLALAGVTDLGAKSAEQVDGVRQLISDKTVPALFEELMRLCGNANAPPFDTPTVPKSLTTSALSDGSLPKIRVGFLSFFFRRHPVGRLLAPIITGLDPSRFDVYLLTSEEAEKRGDLTPGKDEIVDFLRARVAPERRLLVPHYLEAAVEVVRSAHLDILVYGDVFMDSFVAHLAGLRLAAVQVVFWGHPYTTGHASIDYFVTSDTFEAENSQTRHEHFTEQLVRFDSLSFQLFESISATSADHGTTTTLPAPSIPAYVPRTADTHTHNCSRTASTSDELWQRVEVLRWIAAVGYTLDGSPITPQHLHQAVPLHGAHAAEGNDPCACEIALAGQIKLYGALQSLFKLHPLFDDAIAAILIRDPAAVVVISRTGKQRVWDEHFRQRLRRSIRHNWQSAGAGAGAGDTSDALDSALRRVVFVNQMRHADYSTLLCAMDVTLDTFPFGGGVTLSDALHGCRDSRGAHKSVPFVTAGALQSVHQIGAGIVRKLGDAKLARAVGAGRSTTELTRRIRTATKNVSAPSGSDVPSANFAATLKTVQEEWQEVVVEYAAQAVALASEQQAQTLNRYREPVNRHEQPLPPEGKFSTSSRVRDALFRSNESVQEWSKFLAHVYLLQH